MPAHALNLVHRRRLAEDPLGAMGDFLGFPHRAVSARQLSTVVNVVYYTLPTENDAETQAQSPTTAPRIQRVTQDTTQLRPSRTTQASVQAAMVTRDEGIPSQILADAAVGSNIATDAIIAPVITPPSSSAPVPNAIAIAPGSPASATTHIRSSSDRDTAIQGKATGTADAAQLPSGAPDASVSSGMTTGGKVGIAVGVVLLAAAALSIVIFCVRKRKRKSGRRAKAEDEKNPFSNAAAIKSTPPAAVPRPLAKAVVPRLSLRPVTQFLPYSNERRSSNGIQLAETTPQEQNRNNPFGNHAEAIDPASLNGPAQSLNAGGAVAPSSQPRASVSAPAGTLTRSASKLAPTVDFAAASANSAGPPSPTGTDYSDATDASFNGAAAAAGAMSAGPPGNVHRVQLDFTPQMDDELELRAGQLVRLLHEYDDGWAMCIRFDRSRQGVVPRSCLSTRPVKPRPQQGRGPAGPPRNAPSRGLPHAPYPLSQNQAAFMSQAAPPNAMPYPRAPSSSSGYASSSQPLPDPERPVSPLEDPSSSSAQAPTLSLETSPHNFSSSFQWSVPHDGDVSPISSVDVHDATSNRTVFPGQAL